MALPLSISRLHLFEINDLPWYVCNLLTDCFHSPIVSFPTFLRAQVQTILTEIWTEQIPPIQTATPATLVAKTLQKSLGPKLLTYTFVDLCSGAGGPVPYIEAEVNSSLVRSSSEPAALACVEQFDEIGRENGWSQGVEFILTDLYPNLAAWEVASKASKTGNLRYIPSPVNATSMTSKIMRLAQPPALTETKRAMEKKKTFRLLNLAFHHFTDELAVEILADTLRTSSGFAIFELQGRDIGSLLTVLSAFPVLWLGSWWWDWGEGGRLFWSGVVPVVPSVVAFDGVVSCLRTRREKEIYDLLRRATAEHRGGLDGWRFETGEEMYSILGGRMTYFIGVKEEL